MHNHELVSFKTELSSLRTEDIPHVAFYPSTRAAHEPVELASSLSDASIDFVFHDRHGAIRPGGAVHVCSPENGGLLVSGFLSSFVYQSLRDGLQYSLTQRGSSPAFIAAAARFVESTATLAFFVGLLSDCVPFFGYNRKSYLLLGWAMVCVVLLVMVLTTQLASSGGLSPYTFTCLAACGSVGTMVTYVASEIRLVELAQREPLRTRGVLVAVYTICRIAGQLTGRVACRLVLVASSTTSSNLPIGLVALLLVSLIAPACVSLFLREPKSTRPRLPWQQGFAHFKLLIQQRVVRYVVGFVCVYSAFSNVRTAEVDRAVAHWVGVGAHGEFGARLGRDAVAIATVGLWSRVLINRSWRGVFACGPLFNAIPPMLLTALVATHVYRADWLYFFLSSLSGVADGLFRIAYLVPLVEICSFGTEGQTVGLILSFDKLLAVLIRTASTELFRGANWSITDALVHSDTSDAHNRVTATAVAGNVLRLLALVALVFLPRQKLQAQQLRVYGTVSSAGASLVVAVFTICLVGVLALDLTLLI